MDEPLPYHKLQDDMWRQLTDIGLEKSLEPKAFHKGAASKSDRECGYNFSMTIRYLYLLDFAGNASDAVRDQMMRHDPKWATFNGLNQFSALQRQYPELFIELMQLMVHFASCNTKVLWKSGEFQDLLEDYGNLGSSTYLSK